MATFTCPTPFLAEANYPTTGFVEGRFCANTIGISCCIPCPIEDWIFTDRFARDIPIAYYCAIPALVMQVFLLVTFAVLPPEISHRHYLSVGLCLSLIILHLTFIVSLGAGVEHKAHCSNAVTPIDMHDSMSCAWSGAFLVWGGMAADIWVLLRSLWTHLRVVWNVKRTGSFFWISQVIGWGLPSLFLAVEIVFTGVSYRLGPACVPNQKFIYLTWLGWLMGFACLGAFLQVTTTLFCLWLYISQALKGSSKRASTHASSTGGGTTPSSRIERNLSWIRVRQVLEMQWRSIVLSVLVIFACVFFSVPFLQTNLKPSQLTAHQNELLTRWEICLVFNQGDKHKCQNLATELGIDEGLLIGAVFFVSMVGLLSSVLMVRGSMFIGWWRLIRYQTRRPSIGEDFIIMTTPQRKSFGRPLESEKMQHNAETPADEDDEDHTVPPTLTASRAHPDAITTIPEAGDVSARHETIDWFHEDYEEKERERRRKSQLDDVA